MLLQLKADELFKRTDEETNTHKVHYSLLFAAFTVDERKQTAKENQQYIGWKDETLSLYSFDTQYTKR